LVFFYKDDKQKRRRIKNYKENKQNRRRKKKQKNKETTEERGHVPVLHVTVVLYEHAGLAAAEAAAGSSVVLKYDRGKRVCEYKRGM
jgi:hypothetical protein